MNSNTFDPRPGYQGALDQLEKLIAAITPEQLGLPTPCTEYDLRELLGHTVGGIHRIAYVGEGGRSQDVAAGVGEIADTAWAEVFERARARVTAAWADDARLDAPAFVPWGEVPGRAGLGGYYMEAVTHSWDIARATGQEALLDEELAQVALGVAQAVLPAEPRGGGVPFGPVQPVADDAPVYHRLAAWLGRGV
ncbi:TIGR03086 family metal-binding protein [Kitasatospora sp. NPDC002227]|uniref:TIGR03086 family metal-binding protein n=1 Tax=Kitasatospora sp. NPDC002227 TaxID=3154773 RepID=UPI00331758A8